MTNPQILMAFSTVLGELACYKAEHGELAGQTEYRCALCGRPVFGPAQLNSALGPPAHSECLLQSKYNRLEMKVADRDQEIVALRAQLGVAEKK